MVCTLLFLSEGQKDPCVDCCVGCDGDPDSESISRDCSEALWVNV